MTNYRSFPLLAHPAVWVDAAGMEIVPPMAETTIGERLPAVYDPLVMRLGRLEGMLSESGIMKRSWWPMLLAAVGGAIAGAIAGYAAGGVVCRVRKTVGF